MSSTTTASVTTGATKRVLTPQVKEQRRIYNATYHAAHREERRIYRAAYDAERREEKRIYDAAYRAEHREERRSYDAVYRAEHKEEQRTHHAAYDARHPLHNTWNSMIQRCHNSKRRDFPRYGGRGVEVCEEWRTSFASFEAHVTALPRYSERKEEGLTLDRIENDDNYRPGNVRWATRSEQNNNCRPRSTSTQRELVTA